MNTDAMQEVKAWLLVVLAVAGAYLFSRSFVDWRIRVNLQHAVKTECLR